MGYSVKKLLLTCSRNTAGHVVKLAIPHLHEKYPENMKRLKQILHLSWDIGQSHRRIDKSQLWSDAIRLAKPENFNGKHLR